MKTKIFAFICAASLLASAAPVVSADTGSAAESLAAAHKRPENQTYSGTLQSFDVKSEEGSYMPSQEVTGSSAEVQNSAGQMITMDLIDYFRDQTENFAETIDVTDFCIEYDESTFNELYEMLVFCSPKSYYLISDSGMYSYFYPEVDGDGFITYLYPVYTRYYYTTDENLSIYDEDVYIVPEKLEAVKAYDKTEEKQGMFDAVVEDIKSSVDDQSSDLDKLLIFHDYIVMNYKYAWDDLDLPLEERTHNTVMSLITTGEGLCQSLSVLFNYLVMDSDLDTGFITSYDYESGTAYHTWNMVKLAMPGSKDERWYNIDVTWDENNVERTIGIEEHQKDEGRTDFTYFLMSDDMTYTSHAKSGEYSYVSPGISDDKSLDDIEWKDADSQIVEINGVLYFIDYLEEEQTPALYKMNGAKVEKLFDDFEVLWDYKNQKAYSGLSYVDGSLYFNDAANIYEYHIATGSVTVTNVTEAIEIKTEKLRSAEGRSRADQIYSSYKKDDDLYFCTATIDDDELAVISTVGTSFNTGIDVLEEPCYNEDGNVEFILTSDLKKNVIYALKDSSGDAIGIETKMNLGGMVYEIGNVPKEDVEVIMWDLDTMKPIWTKTTLSAAE